MKPVYRIRYCLANGECITSGLMTRKNAEKLRTLLEDFNHNAEIYLDECEGYIVAREAKQ